MTKEVLLGWLSNFARILKFLQRSSFLFQIEKLDFWLYKIKCGLMKVFISSGLGLTWSSRTRVNVRVEHRHITGYVELDPGRLQDSSRVIDSCDIIMIFCLIRSFCFHPSLIWAIKYGSQTVWWFYGWARMCCI